MRGPTEWQSLAAEAAAAIERWEGAVARNAAEKARSQAATWGDKGGATLCDVLLARAKLLTNPAPDQLAFNLSIDSLPPVPREAALRFEAELGAAKQDLITRQATPPLTPDCSVDLVAATVLGLVARMQDVDRPASRVLIPNELRERAGNQGWLGLLLALESEGAGNSGLSILDAVIVDAEQTGNREVLWTALRLKRAMCQRRGLQLEPIQAQQRQLLESWALTLPSADAAGALRRPDRAALFDTGASSNERRIQSRLIEVSVALAQEREQQRLVDLALNAALALTNAERGILLLKDPSTSYRIAATRYVDGRSPSSDLLGLSSTIAERVFSEGEAVVSSDVRKDDRFTACASIAMEVTSVLCVPIHARAALEGAIYLDRTRVGLPFAQDAIDAATAVGSMLGAALLNGRIISDLEQRTRELEIAREDLSVALATRTVERDDVSRRLASIQDVVPSGAQGIIGRCEAMRQLLRKLERVAASDTPVLVAGETGVGKELIARAVHQLSGRRDKPFVAVNCGALSENLLEAELFGAEKGAYTGANSARPGLFVAADGGTLFLDEVGDMPPAMQKALLRVLESSEVRAVGSTKTRQVNVRIVSASHRDLLELARSGAFRDDLRYRLEVVRLDVPPLRERVEDMAELCEHLLLDAQRRYNLPARRLAPETFSALCRRRWQGNVRELRHVLAGAALAAVEDQIRIADLPAERAWEAVTDSSPSSTPPPMLDGHELRAESIRGALRATLGHKGKAAELLGISRSTLYRYMETYGIDSRESVRPGSVPPPDEHDDA